MHIRTLRFPEETPEATPEETDASMLEQFPDDEAPPEPEGPQDPGSIDDELDFEEPIDDGPAAGPGDAKAHPAPGEVDAETDDPPAEAPSTAAEVHLANMQTLAGRMNIPQDEIDDWSKSPALFEQYLATFDAPDDPGEVLPAAGDDADGFEITLSRDEYEGSLIDQLEAMNAHYRGRDEARDAAFNKILSSFEKRESREAEADFDGIVATLTKDWKSVLGDGPSTTLKPGPQLDARRAVQEQMKTVAAGYEARGMEVPSDRELFDQAVKTALADDATKIERSKVRDELSRRQRRSTARPTDREARPAGQQPGTSKATATVARFMEERGMLSTQYRGYLNGS